MKKVFIAMIGMFLLVVWPFGGLWSVLFTPIVGGGAEESFLYPLYGGIILLAGIIIGAATIICGKIDALKRELDSLHQYRKEEKADK